MRWVFVVVLAFVLLSSVGRQFGNAPVNPKAEGTVRVDIPQGSSARAVAEELAKAGVLRSPTGFVAMTILRGAREKLQAGTYEFSPRDSGAAILRRLMQGDTSPKDVNITFPEGFTLQQIAERLDAQGIVQKDSFLAAASADRFRSEFSFLQGAPAGASLEGYLFPDTYRFYKDSDPRAVIQRMLQRFQEQLDVAQRETGATPGGQHPASSVHALVTMASIVEREVQSQDDMKLVAGILWDRLRAGIGLEADATVHYVTGDWEHPLTVKDLALDSPYNTRKYRGLPPGPIGNPGVVSLKAALKPEPSKFGYYLSAPDGRTIFSATLEEHNRAKVQHLKR
ncbi:MAG: endolytic transglycosylase MltG [bacterium]|nr:endolytic transglycosylase MltG [bacterium]